MPRASRASAVAAARLISAQAETEALDGGDGLSVRATTRAKRKREASAEYEEDGDGDGGMGYEEHEGDIKDIESDVETRRVQTPPGPRTTTDPTLHPAQSRRKDNGRRGGRKGGSEAYEALCRRLFVVGPRCAEGVAAVTTPAFVCCPPERRHTAMYHRPQLLDGADGQVARRALLKWYDSVSSARRMPWRQPWVHPAESAESVGDRADTPLAVRAYQVWVSEIMAQQTRIAVVVDYWERWMARWPTVAHLAAAPAADVLAAWSGLGYYSRAARLHTAAQRIMAAPDLRGLLPADPAVLAARLPGVGRYTAGAVAAIVFGRAAAMVDGNVARVLSRQMGLYGDIKTDAALLEVLWAAADALVRVVAWDDGEDGDDASWDGPPPLSDRPGRWGQALMELGATVCTTPTPHCDACPIQTTCRAYAEGLRLHEQQRSETAITVAMSDAKDDDLCPLCEPFAEDDGLNTDGPTKGRGSRVHSQQNTLSAFDVEDASAALPIIVQHARHFPLRRPKKPVRAVETIVCAVRVQDGSGGQNYLLQQRPPKGLLANMWQLPSLDFPDDDAADSRKAQAAAFVGQLLGSDVCGPRRAKAAKSAKSTIRSRREKFETDHVLVKPLTHLGTVSWLYSHLRQTMHVFLIELGTSAEALPTPAKTCWASSREVGTAFTISTGMRKCWKLVEEHELSF